MSNVDLEAPTDDASVGLPPLPGSDSDKPRLDLSVEISDAGPCRKRLKVAISRGDIDREFTDSLKDLRKEAVVPGFRPGKAPAQLVERRFRREISDQVKGKLLMACIEQLDDELSLNPLSTPDLDVNAIVLPEQGPMTFEMELEVPPDFELADYKSLRLERPQGEVAAEDIDARVAEIFETKYGQNVPKTDGPTALGDVVVADLTFHLPNGEKAEKREVEFRLRDELRLADGSFPNIGKALVGANPGDARETECAFADNVADASLRGQTVKVEVKVLDLKRVRAPEVTADFVQSMDYSSIDDFRASVESSLKRRLEHIQLESLRKQIADQLLAKSELDIPQDLVERQAEGLLVRHLDAMRNAGYSDSELLRARIGFLRDPMAEAKRMLGEFFLLARIAMAENLETQESDANEEIERIAAATGETSRRVRARLERDNQLEGLTSLILERKTLQKIIENAQIEDVPMPKTHSVEALADVSIVPASAPAS